MPRVDSYKVCGRQKGGREYLSCIASSRDFSSYPTGYEDESLSQLGR